MVLLEPCFLESVIKDYFNQDDFVIVMVLTKRTMYILPNLLASMVKRTICDRICENRPHCKKCTLEIRVFERSPVVLEPNIFYCTTVRLGPLATSWWSLTVISASIRAL